MKFHDEIDEAHQTFLKITDEVKNLEKQRWSEADTRIKIIDRILFEVLGWSKNDSSFEDPAGSGYADYTLKYENRAMLVVEAKKEHKSFGIQNRHSGKPYKLNGATFDSVGKEAIKQAITYSAFKSIELACATNGSEWIIFRANRLGDGTETLEGKGFVFSSLESICDNFQKFYDLLNATSVFHLIFRGEFQNAEGIPVRDLSFFASPRNPDSKSLLDRGKFAADFDAIMSAFFERLKGDQDPDMIQKCFVVTPESNLAEEKLLRIAADLSEKMINLNPKTGEELVDLIENVKLTHKNRFILLVGNKGAGKSTFIDRFFRFILPKDLSEHIKVLRVDLSKNSGDVSQVLNWLDRELLTVTEKVVIESERGKDGWDEYVGKIFFADYQRWSTTTMKHLYENDRSAFKIEFGRHIENTREDRPNDYIRKMIFYLTKSHHKIPCLIFDNTDHFSIQFQEVIFQYARALYENEFCIAIMPITDKTSWQLSKQGALQSFESESLFLPVPRPEKVIERRTAYLIEKLDDSNVTNREQYFLNKGIRLNLNEIGKFASNLNKIFVESPSISGWIGGLVNHDIRRLLELTRDTISSPHLDLDDLLKVQVAGSAHVIPEYRIKAAIIKRRYDIYPAGEHSFVQNVFSLSSEISTTPILGLRIIQFLTDVTNGDEEGKLDFIPVEDIYRYCLLLRIPKMATQYCLRTLLRQGLVLNFDPTVKELDDNCKLEVAPSGLIHFGWATTDRDYVNYMKDVTPLRSKEVCENIRSAYYDYKNKWAHAIGCFIDYIISEDEFYCDIPLHANFERQRKITRSLNNVRPIGVK